MMRMRRRCPSTRTLPGSTEALVSLRRTFVGRARPNDSLADDCFASLSTAFAFTETLPRSHSMLTRRRCSPVHPLHQLGERLPVTLVEHRAAVLRSPAR